ncbi:MAG: hypothetical protein AAGD01_15405 [Acidobacteriota bacterium]
MTSKSRSPWMLRSLGSLTVGAFTLGLILCCGVPAEGSPEAAAEGDGEWRTASIWDDGLAEFAAYSVDWFHYGRSYPGRALLITVKEPWAPDLEVKADYARKDGFEVLKLNHVRDVATGIYTYHQMGSLFWRRDDGELRKAAFTSSEACGITTAEVLGGQLETRSYFDGQGNRKQSLPEGALLRDGLAVSLRSYVDAESGEGTLSVFPTLLAARLPSLEGYEVKLSRSPRPGFETGAGTFDAVEIRLEGASGTDSYIFDAAVPHPLLELRQADGTTYRLEKIERLPYWQMSAPGAEHWLPEGVRH